MAAFYADENFPLPVVEALRRAGHDVLTAVEAGRANRRIPDESVLQFAASSARVLLTINRWDFVALHSRLRGHAGIVVCSQDEDHERQAAAIVAAVQSCDSLSGALLRVNRPAQPLPAGQRAEPL